MNAAASVRWPAIAALTTVSALSQIGQFGIGFMVLPVWLAHRGLDAPRAGLFSASQWTGMLAGLLIAPWLVERIGAKRTVSLGLAATIVAFVTMNALWWPLWLVPGLLTGFGIGLRWIANETWLYRLVPPESSGRVVGVHEALIATAGVIGPALAAWRAVDGRITFAAGAAFTLAAAVPLWLTASDDRHVAVQAARPARKTRLEKSAPIGPLVSLGMVVVAAGGIGDGALYGLFPLFADAHGLSTTQTATLLTLFGVGSMALQYPIGWFADRAGLAATVIVCAALSTLAICGFALAPPASWLADASALLLGGMNSAYITLGMVAAACSHKAALTRNMRLVSLTFTASSIVGPLIAGFAMKARGSDMLMWQLAIMSGALVAYTLGLREGRRNPGSAPDRSSSMG
ncbi:MFS transporter [Paraburkholderia haematera]|uniref:MFS-type transporter YcaD n=1 Tax=Paraburkholderia haematera TaxID=2793077 RepID=A0ABN7N2P5_9BURK|nr:MFS transporter [Paraburkholderia haematera]CAE6839788.1 putative MFS-type transporter YcaD [Paraburkholderia haematera]